MTPHTFRKATTATLLALVLAANLFADAVREAFDPRARAFRVRRAKPGPARAAVPPAIVPAAGT